MGSDSLRHSLKDVFVNIQEVTVARTDYTCCVECVECAPVQIEGQQHLKGIAARNFKYRVLLSTSACILLPTALRLPMFSTSMPLRTLEQQRACSVKRHNQRPRVAVCRGAFAEYSATASSSSSSRRAVKASLISASGSPCERDTWTGLLLELFRPSVDMKTIVHEDQAW
jgi:hypothetical protein